MLVSWVTDDIQVLAIYNNTAIGNMNVVFNIQSQKLAFIL